MRYEVDFLNADRTAGNRARFEAGSEEEAVALGRAKFKIPEDSIEFPIVEVTPLP